jgi:prohibitin 1
MKWKLGCGFVVLIVLFLAIFLIKGWAKVDAGYGGVIYNASGGVEKNPVGPGYQWVGWFKHIREYPTSTETVFLDKNDAFNVSTQEGKQVTVEARYSYHMDFDKLPIIYNKFRGRTTATIEEGFIKNTLQSVIQNVTSNYAALDVYGSKRDEITTKVSTQFKTEMAVNGITVELYAFGEIIPDKDTLGSIQSIVNAQNALKKAELMKQQITIEADQKRIAAQGTADSKLIEAQGQAKANEVLKISLSPELVQYTMWSKWNGQLPTVQGGGTPLLQMPIPTGK